MQIMLSQSHILSKIFILCKGPVALYPRARIFSQRPCLLVVLIIQTQLNLKGILDINLKLARQSHTGLRMHQ